MSQPAVPPQETVRENTLRLSRLALASQPGDPGEDQMLYWAVVFLVVGLIAAALGFTSIAGGAFAIAKFLAGLFLVLFLVFLVLGLTAARRIVD